MLHHCRRVSMNRLPQGGLRLSVHAHHQLLAIGPRRFCKVSMPLLIAKSIGLTNIQSVLSLHDVRKITSIARMAIGITDQKAGTDERNRIGSHHRKANSESCWHEFCLPQPRAYQRGGENATR